MGMDSKGIEKLVLVGAKGQMGKLLHSRFTAAGVQVSPLDRPFTGKDLPRVLDSAQMVLMAVPVSALDQVLGLLGPVLDPSAVLADICSVKTVPLQKMQALFKGPVMGTHPLFGPSPAEGEDLKVALCPGNNLKDEDINAVHSLFGRAGIHAFVTTAREHDQAMACIQGLNFVTTITYFASMPQDIDLDKFATPSFRRRINAAHKMLNEDAMLFSSLAEDNPYTGQMIRRFKSFLNLSAAGDFELLTDRALWWWRNYSNRGGGQ